MPLAKAYCYLCLSLIRVYENPTIRVTVLYQVEGGSEIRLDHSVAEEGPTDYMGVKGSGTRNREVLRNQELVKMLLKELSRCCQMKVRIILKRKFNTNIERTRS